MPFLAELTCGRCAKVDDQVYKDGSVRDPAGWTVVSIHGTPMSSRRLCPGCSTALHRHLATSPGAQAIELERQADAIRERAYTRGYDEGHAAALLERDPMEAGVS